METILQLAPIALKLLSSVSNDNKDNKTQDSKTKDDSGLGQALAGLLSNNKEGGSDLISGILNLLA